MQTAVFVDAGYLYAQSSALLAGSKQPRSAVTLDVRQTITELRNLCQLIAPESRLLRVYWYDGLQRSARMTADQEEVANAAYTKLRLGIVNSHGEQKGVDSLIVTDLIDLARNRAISNALLVSGDEDIRIGVQIAQTFGVQIHLLGIKPSRGSQSKDLIQEADTHHEFDEVIIGRLMTLKPPQDAAPANATTDAADRDTVEQSALTQQAIEETLAAMEQTSRDAAIKSFHAGNGAIRQELDRPALGRLRNLCGRDLTADERKAYRVAFRLRLERA